MLHRRAYRRGEVVFHAGDPGDTLHIVRRGHAKIVVPSEAGEEAVLTVVRSGDLFGEITLLDGEPRSATVVALEDLETATLSRMAFRDLMRRSPATVEILLAEMAATIRRLTTDVVDLMFLDLRGRLAKKLLELAETHGATLPDGSTQIQVHFTQEELAGMIGATRPRVNQLLGFFEDGGLIGRQGRSITILKPDSLGYWTGGVEN
jgi:CRP/FNR family transcriptional regulator/CRP/FNR family cyclic AMP-dependent transcriptional regulator